MRFNSINKPNYVMATNDQRTKLMYLLKDKRLLELTNILAVRYRGVNYVVKVRPNCEKKLEKVDFKVITDNNYKSVDVNDSAALALRTSELMTSRYILYVADNSKEIDV